MGDDPLLINPQAGNYQVEENSPAQGYGCQTFGEKRAVESGNSVLANHSKKRNVIEVSGEIMESTFWNADTVLVVGNISLENQATLTIAAGTQVLFEDYYVVHVVNGNIIAEGDAENRIRFSSLHPELFSLDESYFGAWQGFFFDNVPAVCAETRFEYCLFEYGKAVSESRVQGGAIHVAGSNQITIENCIFRNNVAYFGGAVSTSFFANPMFMSSLFYHNYNLLKGSAFHISNSYPQLINNTIVDNHSLNPDGNDETATVFTYFSKPKFYNNIIRQNSTTYFEAIELRESKLYYTEHNNVEQFLAGYQNIDSPAEFSNFEEEDFSLSAASPCIDAGFLSANYEFPEFDLAGNDRIAGSRIDIGAYEYHSTANTPEEFVLKNAISIFPNPFNAETSLSFELLQSSFVQITVFNSKGQKVNTLLEKELQRGEHTLFWSGKTEWGKDAASGLYLFQLKVDGFTKSMKKGILLK